MPNSTRDENTTSTATPTPSTNAKTTRRITLIKVIKYLLELENTDETDFTLTQLREAALAVKVELPYPQVKSSEGFVLNANRDFGGTKIFNQLKPKAESTEPRIRVNKEKLESLEAAQKKPLQSLEESLKEKLNLPIIQAIGKLTEYTIEPKHKSPAKICFTIEQLEKSAGGKIYDHEPKYEDFIKIANCQLNLEHDIFYLRIKGIEAAGSGIFIYENVFTIIKLLVTVQQQNNTLNDPEKRKQGSIAPSEEENSVLEQDQQTIKKAKSDLKTQATPKATAHTPTTNETIINLLLATQYSVIFERGKDKAICTLQQIKNTANEINIKFPYPNLKADKSFVDKVNKNVFKGKRVLHVRETNQTKTVSGMWINEKDLEELKKAKQSKDEQDVCQFMDKLSASNPTNQQNTTIESSQLSTPPEGTTTIITASQYTYTKTPTQQYI